MPQRVSGGVRAPVFAEPAEPCDAGADCPDEATFGEPTAACSAFVTFFFDAGVLAVDAESTVIAESAFVAPVRSSVFVQEQSSSAAGKRTLRRMQSCV